MKISSLLPIVIMGLSAAAGIVYLFDHDWRHAAYWLAAATIAASVTL